MSVELAYAAGLIDGEGCIGTYHNSHNGNYQLRITVEMCERQGLELLFNLFGGKWYYKPPKNPRRGRYVLMLFNSKAEEALRKLYPYLLVKKEHARIALIGDWSSFNSNNPLTPEEKSIRKDINERIKKLNERGYYN